MLLYHIRVLFFRRNLNSICLYDFDIPSSFTFPYKTTTCPVFPLYPWSHPLTVNYDNCMGSTDPSISKGDPRQSLPSLTPERSFTFSSLIDESLYVIVKYSLKISQPSQVTLGLTLSFYI